MPARLPRDWVPGRAETRVRAIAASAGSQALADRLGALIARNRQIQVRDCFNLNPATNVMNPAAGLGALPARGYPGANYETGLEAIEEIEVIAQELAAETFAARFAEIRVAAEAMANSPRSWR